MAIYAIGDVQGCFDELMDLVALIGFEPSRDHLWLAGDLVNRGPDSLGVLRFVHDLGKHATVVLGNHDLHLLAAAADVRVPKSKDTFDDVLAAPDRDALCDWLRNRPLVHHDAAAGFTMVHAGLAPHWNVEEALARSAEVESRLRDNGFATLLSNMYGNEPDLWHDELGSDDRLRYIINACTRLRFVRADGGLDSTCSDAPGSQPRSLTPWYAAANRRSAGARIVFGHWATLRLGGAPDPQHGVFHLDTGCVWGGELTALRLDDIQWFSVPSRQPKPGEF